MDTTTSTSHHHQHSNGGLVALDLNLGTQHQHHHDGGAGSGGNTSGTSNLTPLQLEVLDEYARLARNMDRVSYWVFFFFFLGLD